MARATLNPGDSSDVIVGQVDTPVRDNDAANKAYVDAIPTGGLATYATTDDLPVPGTTIRIALVRANNEVYRWDASLDTPAWVILDDGGGGNAAVLLNGSTPFLDPATNRIAYNRFNRTVLALSLIHI